MRLCKTDGHGVFEIEGCWYINMTAFLTILDELFSRQLVSQFALSCEQWPYYTIIYALCILLLAVSLPFNKHSCCVHGFM